MTVSTREGTLQEALDVAHRIPEFEDLHSEEVWRERLACDPLVLLGLVESELAGFKVGYDRWRDGKTYYSWMGGVLPPYRRSGLASALQRHMEVWCVEHGYSVLRFKTRNQHRKMIAFAVRNDFNLIELEKRPDVRENRLLFEKTLRNATTDR